MSRCVTEIQVRPKEMADKNNADSLNNGNSHKIVSERELISYLDKGWKLIQYNPRGDKAVIELPD